MGFGTSPAGVFPFGYGAPVSAAEPPDGPSGRPFLNASGDYEQDPDTRQLKQMPSLRQRVLIRVKTMRGSSSVLPLFGIQVPDKMGAGFERKLEFSIRQAFRVETDIERIMRIEQVIVRKVSSGRAEATIIYTDLTTGETAEVTA
jgi:phage baseplate assembly protein W